MSTLRGYTVLYFFILFFLLQSELLDDHIKTLQRVLKPGSKRLNWNSLGIQDYISKCEQVLIIIMCMCIRRYTVGHVW